MSATAITTPKDGLGDDQPASANLTNYDSMCNAIAMCARVDEVKDIRDKAMALKLYFKQARNLEAERQANNVRIRAEIRSGELLKELARATPAEAGVKGNIAMGRMSDDRTCVAPSPYAEALTTNNISRQAANRFQALAAVLREVLKWWSPLNPGGIPASLDEPR